MKDDYTYLFQLAKKATKGDWIAVGRWVENTRDDLPDIVCPDSDRGDSDEQQCADANFIGAANPKTIMRMIREIRQLRKAVRI